jgi:hypothetical protein
MIAAIVTPPEAPAVGEKQARPEIWRIVVVIMFVVGVVVGLIVRRK